ncbi:hypothetical protein [Rhodococcus sp. H29-C3]|uniref:hypothetical protein n=1 Tax=Rhodococcus sp. H29-C3 TaxID=3046307 RepID=UPI0024B95B46|nr:hypothetical protein [Rhodococcus sp. H29-C3]MDJ0363000.1 hypothetical protein [Rhodococcus sp. H29-C3]
MPGTDLTIDSRPVAVTGIEHGRGRLRSITVETTIHGRGTPMRTGRYTLTAPTFGTERRLDWTNATDEDAARTSTTRRPQAAAQ